MKKIYILVILFLVLSLTLFNNQIIAKSKYQTTWQELIENNQELIKKKDSNKNTKARFRLGVAYANLGKIDLAKKEFDSLKDLDDGKKAKEIIAYYKTKLEAEPENPIFLNYLGFAYYANNNYKSSLKIFKKIIKYDSQNIWSYNYLGTIYGKLEKYKSAKKVLKESLELENNKYTHFLLGAVYYKQGNIFKALYHVGRSGKVATKLLNW